MWNVPDSGILAADNKSHPGLDRSILSGAAAEGECGPFVHK